MRILWTGLLAVLVFSGCGSQTGSQSPAPVTSGGPTTPSDFIVKAQALVDLNVGSESMELEQPFASSSPAPSASGSIPVSVTVTASTSMTINSSSFAVPTLTSSLLSFGTLGISALSDNNLALCGNAGNQHCSNAMIRIYTTGQSGAGLWNNAGGYGAPITAGFVGGTMQTVGLNEAGAAVLETYSIPTATNVMHLSNFTPVPTFQVNVDFSNAGVGSYQTTLVIEYALSQ
jgi:hypothetical protein